MTETKELFLSDKEMTAKLFAVTREGWFRRSLAFVRSELMSRSVTDQQLQGAQAYERILCSMATPEEPAFDGAISSGLHHNLDVLPRKAKPDEKKVKP